MITTQRELRRAFWDEHPQFSRAKHERAPNGHCDTRCAFVDWIDSLQKSGEIPESLAQRATL